MSTDEWATASIPFGEAVEAYFRNRGRDATDPAVRSTVRTNTELVPQRAEHLLDLLQGLSDRKDLTGTVVAEVGCGFGALATYLAWSSGSRRIIGVDVRADFIESARESAENMNLTDRLGFAVDDMRKLATIEDGSVDVAILNNAFIYLTSPDAMDEALSAVHRILAPNGHILLFHANKWTPREPFTRAPIVHLLSPRIADAVSRVAGWEHSHGRVRLIGPREMRRRLQRAGFTSPNTGTIAGGQLRTGRGVLGKRWYGAAAKRPS